MTVTSGLPPQRNWARVLGLAALLFVVAAALSALPVVREWQLRLGDTYFRIAPRPAQRSPVVVVLIDDQSLERYGRWPWSRTLLARLTRALDQADAQVIGLDILLSEPQSPEADRALQQALAESGRAVIVDKIGAYPDGPHWIEPLPGFSQVAAVGHAQAVLDRDGVCRSFPPRELTPDGSRWAFAVEMARRAAPQPTARFLAAYQVPFAGDAPAVLIAKPVLVPIAFRRDAFTTISAAAVLEGRDLATVQGRPVIVGFGPTEIGDRISTPLSGELPTPGVEVHAQALDSILAGRRLRELPAWVAVAMLLFTCTVVVGLSRWLRGWVAIAALGLVAAGVYAAGFLALVLGMRLLPAGPSLLAVVLGPVLVYATDLVIVERSVNRQLRDLRRWLASKRPGGQAPETADLFWRLNLLHRLQGELGSAYELHQTLLESTRDLVAIFDADGSLMLKNRAFAAVFLGSGGERPTLPELRARLLPEAASTPDVYGHLEGESEVNGELYSVGIAPLPPTTLSPGGGSVLTLASLRTRVERDRARAEALGFVTHELRTPLVAIQGFAEMMMHYPSAPACATAPATIFQESRRLLEMISSYLDVLRLDAGARPLRRELVHPQDLARKVFELIEPIAAAAEMRLVLDDGDAAPIVGDAALLSGAVLNLVSNAIKYAKPGTEIRIRCARAGDDSVISVHNVGEPIPPDALPRLFDTFYRPTQAEAAQTGWGLGLAFVKRIAEKHGGSVRVASDGAATVFEIRFPIGVIPAELAAAVKGTT